MRIRNVALLFGAVLLLMTVFIAESGGGAKGGDTTPAGGRRGRSAIDPAVAAAEPTADELLAQLLACFDRRYRRFDRRYWCFDRR